MAVWEKKRVLITVRTYPIPAQTGIEVSCTAGITNKGRWIRLFPVPYRFLENDKRFKKYQWIEVDTTKARNDTRPESFKLNAETINIISTVPSTNHWNERKKLIFPLKEPSLCSIQRKQKTEGSPTLGFFRPKEITCLSIEPTSSEWTMEQQHILSQELLFPGNAPQIQLEKIPYDFRYFFSCEDPECSGHKMMCTDWELGQSYRKWRVEYGKDWEGKFRQTFEEKMKTKYDTHFFVGTIHGHPGAWIIVGLFYPAYANHGQPDLFNGIF